MLPQSAVLRNTFETSAPNNLQERKGPNVGLPGPRPHGFGSWGNIDCTLRQRRSWSALANKCRTDVETLKGDQTSHSYLRTAL